VRKILTCSAAIPGGPIIGALPNSPDPNTTVTKRRFASEVLYSSINSLNSGVSGKRGSRFLPP
jgi:hypothetical protein